MNQIANFGAVGSMASRPIERRRVSRLVVPHPSQVDRQIGNERPDRVTEVEKSERGGMGADRRGEAAEAEKWTAMAIGIWRERDPGRRAAPPTNNILD